MNSIKTEVEDVVNELTRNRKIFTAYDITCILRDRLDGEKLSHKDIKKEVHSLFDDDKMGIYQRTQANIGAKASPFVYHLNHQDPNSDYEKDWVDDYLQTNLGKDPFGNSTAPSSSVTAIRRANTGTLLASGTRPPVAQLKTQIPATVHPPHVANSSQVANRVKDLQDGFKSVKVTKEGRLSIPTDMLESLGSKVYVSLSTARKDGANVDSLTVSSQPSPQTIVSYSINRDGRLRISPKFLNKAGKATSYSIKDASANLGYGVLFVVAD